jgi:hypothetical protein
MILVPLELLSTYRNNTTLFHLTPVFFEHDYGHSTINNAFRKPRPYALLQSSPAYGSRRLVLPQVNLTTSQWSKLCTSAMDRWDHTPAYPVPQYQQVTLSWQVSMGRRIYSLCRKISRAKCPTALSEAEARGLRLLSMDDNHFPLKGLISPPSDLFVFLTVNLFNNNLRSLYNSVCFNHDLFLLSL